MIKIISIFASTLLLFISSSFFYDDESISIQPVIPAQVKAGDEFTVELTISKGMLTGFASLQQYLPEGFTAVPSTSGNASFVFEKQHVTFTWKKLPKEKVFTVSYKIKTDINYSGLKTMNGEFSYIENDKTKKIPLTPSVIMLNDEVTPLSAAEMKREILVEKLIGPSTGKTGEYKVDLLVRKGLRQNAARIFDQLLEGYRAELIDGRGAKFSVTDGLVEFYWEALPRDSVFRVSYRITPDSMARIDYPIMDMLSEDNGSVEACAPVYSFFGHNSEEEKAQHQQPLYANVPPPQKGIYYKIQIAATMRTPDRKEDFFRSKYSIHEPVDITMHEGWKKYLVGNYGEYGLAKQHRSEIQSKVKDAFVVAFNDAERISVNEAVKLKSRNQ